MRVKDIVVGGVYGNKHYPQLCYKVEKVLMPRTKANPTSRTLVQCLRSHGKDFYVSIRGNVSPKDLVEGVRE